MRILIGSSFRRAGQVVAALLNRQQCEHWNNVDYLCPKIRLLLVRLGLFSLMRENMELQNDFINVEDRAQLVWVIIA